MLHMTAMYFSKRELPIFFCVPGLKIFPGVPSSCGGGNTQKSWNKGNNGRLSQENSAVPQQFVP